MSTQYFMEHFHQITKLGTVVANKSEDSSLCICKPFEFCTRGGVGIYVSQTFLDVIALLWIQEQIKSHFLSGIYNLDEKKVHM